MLIYLEYLITSIVHHKSISKEASMYFIIPMGNTENARMEHEL